MVYADLNNLGQESNAQTVQIVRVQATTYAPPEGVEVGLLCGRGLMPDDRS
jgi:hypothetical protein